MNKTSERERSAVLTAVVGLICNLTLGAAKLVVGLISGSLSVAADAANNLSDCGVSAVVVFSFIMSGKRPDREHPYGHGRYEYIASFVVALAVLMVGAELVISSVKGLISPEKPEFSLVTLGVLVGSIVVKSGMAIMYTLRNRKVKSDSIRAAAFDSISDCIVTAIVTAAFLLSRVTDFPVDGVCGLAAGAFVAFGGLKIVGGTVNRLLGNDCDYDVRREITTLVLSDPLVLGAHDLMIHDYGAENKVASIDAEFDCNLSFVKVHDVVDKIEREAYRRYRVNLVVHCDPIDVGNPKYNDIRHAMIAALEPYGRRASFHEMHVDDENKKVSVHLCLDKDLTAHKQVVVAALMQAVEDHTDGYSLEVNYDFL